MFPSIVQAVPGNDFTVYAYCNDGAVRLVDVKPLLKTGGVFSAIADGVFFRERLTVLNGSVAWDMTGNFDPSCCVDLDPCWIFDTAPIVDDPLK